MGKQSIFLLLVFSMVLLTSILVLLTSVLVLPVAGQTQFDIERDEAILDFPEEIHFYLTLESAIQIEKIYLLYGTDGRSCQSGVARQTMDFEPGSQIEVDWTWELKRSGAIPPGTEVWWQWELLDADGETYTTERQTLIIEDDSYEWQTVQADDVTVYFVEGGTTFGNYILNLTTSALTRLTQEMGVTTRESISVVVYPSSEDVRGALIHSTDWVGGVAFPAYNTILVGISPEAEAWAADVMPHEVTHLVVEMKVFNCRGVDLPIWLSEGLAVYGEGDLQDQDLESLVAALEEDRLPSLKSLSTGFSAYGDEARSAYLQSGAVVQFLVEQYGADKLNHLLELFQQGNWEEDALMQNYGFDTQGLDQAWRASLGFSAETSATDVAGESTVEQTATAVSIPTLALWTPVVAPTSTSTPMPTPTLQNTPTQTAVAEVKATNTALPTTKASPDESLIDDQQSSVNEGLPTGGLILVSIIGFIIIAIVVIFILKRRNKEDR